MALLRICRRCGLVSAASDDVRCTSCAEEAELVAHGGTIDRPRACPVCEARMRLNGTPPILVCKTPACGARFDPKTSRLSVRGVQPLRSAAKTLAETNRIVKNEGRRRLKAERRKILETVSGDGAIPPEASPEELLILVLESPHEAARRCSLDRLRATGCERQLREIAASNSPYAQEARLSADGTGQAASRSPEDPGF